MVCVRGPVKAGYDPGGHAVGQAERVADGDDDAPTSAPPPRVACTTTWGSFAGMSVAMSSFGLATATVAFAVVPSANVTVMVPPPGDDVIRGQDRAVVGHDDTGTEVMAGADDDNGRSEPLVDGRDGQVPGGCPGGARPRGLGVRRGRGAGEPDGETAITPSRTTTTASPAASRRRDP